MMKKVLILFVLINAASCEAIKDCPAIVKGKPENHIVTEYELGTIRSLFLLNNIVIERYQFYSLMIDVFGHRHAECYQYVNNLKVLSGDLTFHFNGLGKFYYLSGEYYSNIDIPTTPVMNESDLKKAFIGAMDGDDHYSSSKEKIGKGCLVCELGYYDLNAGTSITTPVWCLAWKVKPDNSEYPMVVINDSKGTLISYDNGIRN